MSNTAGKMITIDFVQLITQSNLSSTEYFSCYWRQFSSISSTLEH